MGKRRDIDIEMGVSGVQDTQRDLQKGGQAVKGVGEEAERTGKKTEAAGAKIEDSGRKMGVVERMARGVTGEIKSMAAGFLSLGAAVAIMNKLAEAMERIRAAQKQMVDEALEAKKGVIDYAIQLHGKAGESEQQDALRRALHFQRVGGFESLSQAAAFGQAAETFATGKTKVQEAMAAKMGTLNPTEIAAAFEVLQRYGRLGSPEQAEMAMAQMQATLRSSDNPFKTVGELAVAMLSGTTTLAGQGASFEYGLQYITRARVGAPSSAEAGTLAGRVAEIAMGSEDRARKFLSGEAQRRGQNFATLDMVGKIALLEDVFGQARTPAAQSALQEFFPGKSYQDVQKFFGENAAAIAAGVGRNVEPGAIDLEAYRQGQQEFLRSQVVKDRIRQAERTGRRMPMGSKFHQVVRLREEAEARRIEREAAGEFSPLETNTATRQRIMAEILYEDLPKDVQQLVTGKGWNVVQGQAGLTFQQGQALRTMQTLLGGVNTGMAPERVQRMVEAMPTIVINNNQNQVNYNAPPEARREVQYGDVEGVR